METVPYANVVGCLMYAMESNIEMQSSGFCVILRVLGDKGLWDLDKRRRTDKLKGTAAINYSFVEHRGRVYCIGRSWKGSNLASWLGKSNGNHLRLCEAEV
ncbi:unnamed protein product [Prunus armeniaca]